MLCFKVAKVEVLITTKSKPSTSACRNSFTELGTDTGFKSQFAQLFAKKVC
jgi:hypothetical protein